jgi:hypothetical protein
MGLDVVEMIMEVEDSFGVQIPDQAAERMQTLGDLYGFLLHHLQPYRDGVCMSGAVFYRLRRALGELFGVERHRVRPDARLEDLLPGADWPHVWGRLASSLRVPRLPPLELPIWFVVALGLAFFVPCGVGLLFHTPLIALSVLVLLAGALGARLLAGGVPYRCGTVGGLVRATLALNYVALAQVKENSDAQEVWSSLRHLIATHAGVAEEQLTQQTRFNDLW